LLEAMMKARRTTLSQIADAAGVSIPTVSKVLNNRGDVSAETRRRVEKHLRAAAYRRVGANSTRQHRRSRQIEVVLDGPLKAYGMTVLNGITSSAQMEGFEIMVSRRLGVESVEVDVASVEVDASALLASDRAGAIFLTMDASGLEFQRLSDAGFPVVVVDPLHTDGTKCITIGATNFTGAVTATEYLLSLGHRRIGHAGGPASIESSQARLAGYASALRRVNIPLEESLITHVSFDYEAGMKAGRELFNRADTPTAVFAASDEIALGVMEEARRRDIRVPQDLSIVGFDDTFLATRATPPLTTVAQPLVEMGQLAVRSLAQVIASDRVGTSHIELATRLVVRGSTSRLG
jgi:LacI family transcriptional regulator